MNYFFSIVDSRQLLLCMDSYINSWAGLSVNHQSRLNQKPVFLDDYDTNTDNVNIISLLNNNVLSVILIWIDRTCCTALFLCS